MSFFDKGFSFNKEARRKSRFAEFVFLFFFLLPISAPKSLLPFPCFLREGVGGWVKKMVIQNK